MINIADWIKKIPLGESYLVFLGQAGFIIRNKAGKLLAIDLYLSNCVARYDGFKRLIPIILEPEDIIFDYVVTTHAHYDHFDPDSIPGILNNRKTALFASTGCEKEIKRLGIENNKITYVKVGDHIDIDDIKLDFVFCDHGNSTPDALGVIIESDGKLIYYTGDTCLRVDKVEEIKKNRRIDIMIAPINGTFGNMNSSDVVTLCSKVKPDLFIPCHFGCFVEQWGNPAEMKQEIKKKLPNQKYNIMRLGEKIEI